MKKIVTSFILTLCLALGVLSFSACENSNSYKMEKLATEFYAVADINENIKNENSVIGFDYTVYTYEGAQYLNNLLLDENGPYANLITLSTVLDKSLDFTYAYIETCSNNLISASASSKNKIKNNLNAFKSSVMEVSYNIDSLSNVVKLFISTPTNATCMSSLSTLINSYEQLIKDAINLNNSVYEFYYKYALTSSNIDAFNSKNNFEAIQVVNLLNGRIHYQISALTQNYAEQFLFSKDLATNIVANGFKIDLEVGNYLENINSLSFIDVSTANQKASSDANKDEFYELSIQLYNAQEIMNNDYEKNQKAYKDVDYLKVEDGSAHENLCLNLIENHHEFLQEYNAILVKILAIVL